MATEMFSELEEQRIVRAIANAERDNRGEVQVRVERRCPGNPLVRAKALYNLAGLAGTQDDTGVLLYISLAERTAVVIPDLAVRRAMPPEAWARAVLGLRDLLARGAPATALLAPISALGDLCGEVLPRADDDRNELPDAVQS